MIAEITRIARPVPISTRHGRPARNTTKNPAVATSNAVPRSGCIAIITQLRLITIVVFLIWTAVFLVFYWFYGRKHSTLQAGAPIAGSDAPYTSNFAQPSKNEIREAAERRKANRK